MSNKFLPQEYLICVRGFRLNIYPNATNIFKSKVNLYLSMIHDIRTNISYSYIYHTSFINNTFEGLLSLAVCDIIIKSKVQLLKNNHKKQGSTEKF